MQKIWKITQPDISAQVALAKELNIHPLLAQVILNRGILLARDAKSFLSPSLNSLHDPFKLKDMDKAVKRILSAVRNKEKILIFGDYDVDGITACALLTMALKRLAADVIHYIPHRISEGYGVNKNAIKIAKERGVKLFITVDCGINANKEVELLNKHNIDCIITDHHQPLNGHLPKAYSIINPKQSACKYPDKDLAAVGVVFKIAQALLKDTLEEYLDLVSLGTVADVMVLMGENRIMVKEGLKRINSSKRIGIDALIDACGLKGKTIMPGFISYILGPRINASGRVDSAESALKLVLTEDTNEAKHLAVELNNLNRQRQKIEEDILKEALNIIERDVNFKEHRVIVINKEGWHLGVLGIVASKIADRFYRPAIVISTDNGLAKGSARSIENFHIFDALTNCSDVLDEFGGHKYAAGLSLSEGNIGRFREMINKFAHESLSDDDLIPSLKIDCQIPLSLLDIDLVTQLEGLGPFGVGNPYPVFSCRRVEVKSRPQIMGRDTIKFWVSDGKLTCQAVGFGMGNLFDLVSKSQTLDIAFSPTLDTFAGPAVVQLEIKDIKIP